MNREIKDLRYSLSTPLMIVYSVVAVILFSSYIYIYQIAPFEGALNDVALNTITTLAALIVAGIASAVYLHYQPGDFPRKIWFNLMLGCWLWFLGEAFWGVFAFNSPSGEVPIPSIADACWVGGLAFFTFAFYHQYAIIFPSQKKRIIGVAGGAWVFAILVPLIALLALQAFTFENLIDYYYPIADLAVGIAGIALVLVFQGGALMRPWFGLVVFGVSDFFYAWAQQFGLYDWSSTNNDKLTLIIDSSYLAAYLILGLGFAGHWVLINYGLRWKQRQASGGD
jgi:hypothetical protein